MDIIYSKCHNGVIIVPRFADDFTLKKLNHHDSDDSDSDYLAVEPLPIYIELTSTKTFQVTDSEFNCQPEHLES